jgi:signal peptidase I
LPESNDPTDSRNGEIQIPEKEETTTAGVIIDQVVTLVIAIAIALAIRQFVIEPFRIPSGSMFPTLLIGDHLFVNKLAYGPRLPFSEVRLPGFSEPERGDVVVFEVARAIGSPGAAARSSSTICHSTSRPPKRISSMTRAVLFRSAGRISGLVVTRFSMIRIHAADGNHDSIAVPGSSSPVVIS